MSSIRVAVTSCALVAALGLGTWGTARAFPLHAHDAQQGQLPPRDALTPENYHKTALGYWNKANRDLTLTPAEKLEVIKSGIAAEDRALAINPSYVPSLAYKNVFLLMQAQITTDVAQRDLLIQQARELRERAEAETLIQRDAAARTARATGTPIPTTPSADEEAFARERDARKPIHIGGNVAAPAKVRDVKPEYPAIAQASRVSGVVIVEAIIDPSGDVVATHVLRSIPLLDEAALAAVKQWRYTPTMVDGVPQNVVMTVTVNFSLM